MLFARCLIEIAYERRLVKLLRCLNLEIMVEQRAAPSIWRGDPFNHDECFVVRHNY